ncbi:hypothetical protein [Burkholderia multivorans]|uniref:hypothetical protein n=1 Tax=Burkholderia multivorans TaxID=87883 RepID=UPI0020A114BC|nr:hypothetical protein [Burkholderia multivorans]MCO8592088.1 hypothetical protein [Burkholderia multivorans]MCO8634210.1 hypothetical protein [Burkholderia multivorans]
MRSRVLRKRRYCARFDMGDISAISTSIDHQSPSAVQLFTRHSPSRQIAVCARSAAIPYPAAFSRNRTQRAFFVKTASILLKIARLDKSICYHRAKRYPGPTMRDQQRNHNKGVTVARESRPVRRISASGRNSPVARPLPSCTAVAGPAMHALAHAPHCRLQRRLAHVPACPFRASLSSKETQQ